MGLSGISPMSLLLILAIIITLFGSNKLKSLGSDLGAAIKNFRQSLGEEQPKPQKDETLP